MRGARQGGDEDGDEDGDEGGDEGATRRARDDGEERRQRAVRGSVQSVKKNQRNPKHMRRKANGIPSAGRQCSISVLGSDGSYGLRINTDRIHGPTRESEVEGTLLRNGDT